ncbi:hypothetical protein Dsin_014928 [Dipteronia sinensis]|uniref:CCHC-type domain-containing protein n=1 Tax=Dipteronia sinensis TaxID=43782 RepID=A0AAE0EA98_9ROSI|nr:hypothetical protein Dsin_014928 [Dipteronia sinensis]
MKSFKSKLLNTSNPGIRHGLHNDKDKPQIEEGDVTLTDGPNCPAMNLLEKLKLKLCKHWENALILKIMGRTHTLNFMLAKLRQKWPLIGHWQLTDLDHGYFVARFQMLEDLETVLTGRPWVIANQYLIVKKFKPNFVPGEDEIRRMLVWVRLSKLPMEWIGVNLLRIIGGMLGTTIKFDPITKSQARGCFARFCVELDTTKPLRSSHDVEDRSIKVKYENLGLICFKCGRIGHSKEFCKEGVTDKNEEAKVTEDGTKASGIESDTYGPLMIWWETGLSDRLGSESPVFGAENSRKMRIIGNEWIQNIMGAGEEGFDKIVTDIRNFGHFEVLAILEPRVSGAKATKSDDMLGFNNKHIVEASEEDVIYWKVSIMKMVNGSVISFKLGTFPVELNQTFTTLIPKGFCPLDMTQLKPISVCNTSYKIINKVIVQRLRGLLPKVVSPNQVAFIPGRQIQDNIVVAQGVLHKFKSMKEKKKGFVAWKIDLAKAYDKLQWSFISNVLMGVGIKDNVCIPKRNGGLGIKKSISMNQALLAKIGRRIIDNDDGIWCRLLKHKYLNNINILDSNLAKGIACSSTWKGIAFRAKLVAKGVEWRIDNDAHVKFLD